MMDTQKTPEPKRPAIFQRLSPLWSSLIGLSIASLTAVLFFSPIMLFLTTPIVGAGFDPLSTSLASALFLMICSALVSALVSRQRLRTAIGATSTYTISYILPFFHQELSPHYDPVGHLEPVNMGALAHNLSVVLAGGLLSAYAGAAIGAALSEALLHPLWQLMQRLWNTRSGTRSVAQSSASGPKAPLHRAWHTFFIWTRFFILLGSMLLNFNIGYLLFFSPDVGVHTAPTVSSHGTFIADSMVSPAFHGQRRSFLVYLPPSYRDTSTPERRYPTLYLLHGSPGSEYDWSSGSKAVQSADTLINDAKIPELIMVFPDGSGRSGETSEWGNSFDQKQPMENFVALDLVHVIDQKYRTIPTPGFRAIGGFSMGGFGAMNIAVHHPDIFGSVISLAGYYVAEGSIWGGNRAYMQANSPALVLPADPEAWKLRIFLGAATKDQPYYNDTLQFILLLKALHIDYTFDLQNGYHAWGIWETQLYHALLWLQWR